MKDIKLEQLWEEYCKAEDDRIRSVFLEKLNDFLAAIDSMSMADKEELVFSLSKKIIDEKDSFPVRMPLFEKLILPTLYDGFKNKNKHCARWLAGYKIHLYKSQVAKEKYSDIPNPMFLLGEALQQDPDDILARETIINELAYQLEYAIHEIPSGVLFGTNGANIEQCKILQKDLEEFAQHLEFTNLKEEYADLINECKMHFEGYQNYLMNIKKYDSYEKYLEETKGYN